MTAPMIKEPVIKGWCPSTHAPMQSGDGWILRFYPPGGALTRDQAFGLCDIANRFGNGLLDLTARGNLQLRGLGPEHGPVRDALGTLGLLDEARALPMLMSPVWRAGDLTERMRMALRGLDLPPLPSKLSLVIDCSEAPCLGDVSADFRFERAENGGVILRADGASTGFAVTPQTAAESLRALVDWYLSTGGAKAGRMARHLQNTSLPAHFQGVPSAAPCAPLSVGSAPFGQALGVPFGKIDVSDLSALLDTSDATGLRITPWRQIILATTKPPKTDAFVTDAHDPRLRFHACPGEPACTQAQAQTRELAAQLANHLPDAPQVHVSGCAKGCALPRAAEVTLVGRSGRFDLVRNGAPWDQADRCGLSAAEIIEDLTR